MKGLYTFLILLLFFSSVIQNNVYSQWIQTNGLNGHYVYALHTYGTNIFTGTGAGTYLTTNNGNNWTSVLSISARSLASNGVNIFAGTQTSGIYRSTNNGSNWIQVNNGLTAVYVRAFAVSGVNIFAGTTTAGVFLSTDNGANWIPVNNGLTNLYIFSLLANGTDLYAGTGNDGGIFKSTNNGANWTFSGANNQYVYALVSSGSNIFAGTDLGGVFLSTNNGSSWAQVNNGLTDIFVNSMTVHDSLVFAGTHNGVFYTTNNGNLWIPFSSALPSGSWIYGMTINVPYVFAGTYGNGVWRRLISEAVLAEKLSSYTPDEYFLYQNYPNPFNPGTKIRFDIPPYKGGQGDVSPLSSASGGIGEGSVDDSRSRQTRGGVRLTIYDILGREVATLVNKQLNPGTYEVEWNGTNFPSGIYFYRLAAEGFSETRKMLMIK